MLRNGFTFTGTTLRVLTIVLVLGAGYGIAGIAVPISASRAADSSVPACTIAAPGLQATVEARLPDATDFCELVAQALADDVFQGPVAVVSGLWHYPGAVLSCRLQFRNTHDRLVVHNSTPACAWLMRGSGWHSILRQAVVSRARSRLRPARGASSSAQTVPKRRESGSRSKAASTCFDGPQTH